MTQEIQEATTSSPDEAKQINIEIKLACLQYRRGRRFTDLYEFMAVHIALARSIRRIGATPAGRQQLQERGAPKESLLHSLRLFEYINPVEFQNGVVYSALIPLMALVENGVRRIPSVYVHRLAIYAQFENLHEMKDRSQIALTLADQFAEPFLSFVDAKEVLRKRGWDQEVAAIEALVQPPSKETKDVVRALLGSAFCETKIYECVEDYAADHPRSEKVYNYLWHLLLHLSANKESLRHISDHNNEPSLFSYLCRHSHADLSAFTAYLSKQCGEPGYRGEAACNVLTGIRMSLTPDFVRNRRIRLGYRVDVIKGKKPERKAAGALSERAVDALVKRYGCSLALLERRPELSVTNGNQHVCTVMAITSPQTKREATLCSWRWYEAKDGAIGKEYSGYEMDKEPYIPLQAVKAVFDDLGLRG